MLSRRSRSKVRSVPVSVASPEMILLAVPLWNVPMLMITGVVISTFQDVLAQVIALVAYIPLLSGTGGNAGTQAASLIIRGMSTDEIDVKDALRVMWKEFRVSIILGLVLSAINFGKIILIDGNTPMIDFDDTGHHFR